MQDRTKLLESLLFVSHKPLSLEKLAEAVNSGRAETLEALTTLRQMRSNTGIVLLEAGGKYQLATHPDFTTAVQNFLTADLKQELTDAALEVLAVVAYRGPVTRSEIEVIRGVNSQYSIRHLLMRGLIEKSTSPKGRSNHYQVTTDFLAQIGTSSVLELPNYDTVRKQISELPQSLETPEDSAPTEPQENQAE